jgi:hypothetical protein
LLCFLLCLKLAGFEALARLRGFPFAAFDPPLIRGLTAHAESSVTVNITTATRVSRDCFFIFKSHWGLSFTSRPKKIMMKITLNLEIPDLS